ncbi:hypothetical protein MVEN_01805000 [Mycena venus]|uniref:HD domain-containing protein n=1 Tax=Mycena venus TaxID=2733690 RepID=A0A8H6XKK0_9AGAR|nr:hypothetical protein MVEN_01805000 [Mycena venus]
MPFRKTFDAYVPSNGKELFALTKIKPDYVPFDTLRSIPLDPAHTASFEYAKQITPHEGFIHSIRCYYFALAILHNGFPSGTPGMPQITFEELNRRMYHTCILHDLGWTTTSEGRGHLAGAMTFELHGGIMAFEHLQAAAPDLNAQQVGDIVQSIVLHTSEWASGKSSATKTLMSLSALFDVSGYDAQGPGSLNFLINRKTVQEIEKEYPRGNFAAEGVETLQKEFVNKPDCFLSHFYNGPDDFLKTISIPVPPYEGFLHSIRCYYFTLTILHNGFPSGIPGVPQSTFEEFNRRIYHSSHSKSTYAGTITTPSAIVMLRSTMRTLVQLRQ